MVLSLSLLELLVSALKISDQMDGRTDGFIEHLTTHQMVKWIDGWIDKLTD